MVKKCGLALLAILLTANAASAQTLDTLDTDNDRTYSHCIENSKGSDSELAACTQTEAARILKMVQRKYNTLANDDYFKDWNTDNDFKKLYDQWLTYRNNYCSLYGYALTAGLGTLSRLGDAECLLEMTKRQNRDMDAVIKNYERE